MARSTARKRAMNTLFEADIRGQEFTDLLDARIVYPGAQTPLPTYAIEIVRGVASHRRTIDKALGEALNSWEVKRMPAIDRALARMAAWEILYNEEIQAGVAIDEALSLAKKYSGEDTPDLLFGVLSTVDQKSAEILADEIAWQNERAALAAAEEADADAPTQDAPAPASAPAEDTPSDEPTSEESLFSPAEDSADSITEDPQGN
ncbi:transcription antitermination factor NusB [Alloscardovia macacae]|uniref:Transcription antitermination protein NusB n=1 Tax=Alloscardovia macacae TaxID=1160091 RepID=A0A261F3H3_9BIFI|nr:transcription antitermination factor NusB [Alloscardovia macacae]OZG53677.1 transcription antitermination factor NusB [Alloscardovia macacae]